jgi:hypothetical protein
MPGKALIGYNVQKHFTGGLGKFRYRAAAFGVRWMLEGGIVFFSNLSIRKYTLIPINVR